MPRATPPLSPTVTYRHLPSHRRRTDCCTLIRLAPGTKPWSPSDLENQHHPAKRSLGLDIHLPPPIPTAAMNEFERVGRTILRSVYDPLPTNNSNEPIWCLGQRYDSKAPASRPAATSPAGTPPFSSPAPHPERPGIAEEDSWIRTSADESGGKEAPNGGEDPDQYGGWPHAFLDDFESRAWLTYRSGFTPIQKSQDRKATAAMSFRVRMQNLAQSAFTSDSGFGCMIRSGQCILANTLLDLRLGRGAPPQPFSTKSRSELTCW